MALRALQLRVQGDLEQLGYYVSSTGPRSHRRLVVNRKLLSDRSSLQLIADLETSFQNAATHLRALDVSPSLQDLWENLQREFVRLCSLVDAAAKTNTDPSASPRGPARAALDAERQAGASALAAFDDLLESGQRIHLGLKSQNDRSFAWRAKLTSFAASAAASRHYLAKIKSVGLRNAAILCIVTALALCGTAVWVLGRGTLAKLNTPQLAL